MFKGILPYDTKILIRISVLYVFVIMNLMTGGRGVTANYDI